jgi:p24 family protein alpha
MLLRGIAKRHSSCWSVVRRKKGTTPASTTRLTPHTTGNYKAEAYHSQSGTFVTTPDLSISVTVDETFDNDHRVVNQKTTSSDRPSKFTFSAADAGDHRICFTPSGPAAVSVGGWFSHAGVTAGGVRLTIDMAIGETSKIQSEDQGKIDTIVSKVKELNGRLADIRREQIFQRVSFVSLEGLGHHMRHATTKENELTISPFLQEREAEFRDQSETTNSKIVRWTIVQLVVLGVTCAWQLSHLRSFFIKQKLT